MKEISEQEQLKQVEEFWNANLCGHHFVKAHFPSKDFFEQYSEFRYKKAHHLNKYIDWKSAKNKDVLEIGLGIGTDAVRWAKYAKTYTGVDLTNESVRATQIHFKLKGLKGNIIQGNAENLQFADNSFELIYSHGVLHHTPNITKAFNEVNRVLKNEGKFILMVYSKNSFNYWIRIQFYFRLRLLIEIIKRKLGRDVKEPWINHIRNFMQNGWSYLSWKNFPHHCTDGPDCSISNIYSKKK